MDERARRAYRNMAYAFLGIGGAFLLVALFEVLFDFDYFNASPVRVALLLIAIGGALWWTVRVRPDEADDVAPEEGPDEPDGPGR